MRKFLLLFFLVLLKTSLPVQTLHKPISVNYIGLGAYSLNHRDRFSFTSNQASLAQLKNEAAGVYGKKRFLLNELNNHTGVFVLPTSTGNFGFKTTYYGFSDYNETQLGLAYGRKLGNKVDNGAQFNYKTSALPVMVM